jgi:tetratricopeptide (TPR) repeat protein
MVDKTRKWRQNYMEALKYCKMAFEKGNIKAINNLGYMYKYGKGVEQNYEEAIKYYKMAIEKGDNSAMNNLGYMYGEGRGVELNYEESIKYYKMAIEQGNEIAKKNIKISIQKVNKLDNRTKYKCYRSLMRSGKTRKYAKKIAIKCDTEETINLYNTIEELKTEWRRI